MYPHRLTLGALPSGSASIRTVSRKLLWIYALLMLLLAIGYARFDPYMMDGDGVAFLDIAQYLRTGHAALAINGYWNPGYPAVLAVAEWLTHPTLWREFVVVRYTNVLIFAFAAVCCLFFTTGLTRARARQLVPLSEGRQSAVPDEALHLLGLALLVFSLGRELPVGTPRSDTLLLAFLLLAAGLALRLRSGGRFWIYPALGLTLGCAYLTKSFAFLPSLALILALLGWSLWRLRGSGTTRRWQPLAGFAIVAAVFALTAGPYIVAISRQLDHLTTGDSARLNYAFFIDGTDRWHEAFHNTLGHATGPFLHPETALATAPPVFSYAAHPVGTFPLWFDPAWWTAGLKPHVSLPGHAARLARNLVVLLRYLLGRPEVFILLAVVLSMGATWPRLRSRPALRGSLWALVPLVWGLLMFGIYLPIDLQDRYLTGPFLLILLPAFALLSSRHPATIDAPAANNTGRPSNIAAGALVSLFAGIAMAQACTALAEHRRYTPPSEQSHPGYSRQFFTAAAALKHLGLRPGGKLACMGDQACYIDQYWARLADAQILAEVETPGEQSPDALWNSVAAKERITAPLAAEGIEYIVTEFPNSLRKPAGWVQLGPTNFFAYPLGIAPSPAQVAEVAAFSPAP